MAQLQKTAQRGAPEGARWLLEVTALVLLGLLSVQPAASTWSIVAVDAVTGEVGSAGASCTGGPFPHPMRERGSYIVRQRFDGEQGQDGGSRREK